MRRVANAATKVVQRVAGNHLRRAAGVAVQRDVVGKGHQRHLRLGIALGHFVELNVDRCLHTRQPRDVGTVARLAVHVLVPQLGLADAKRRRKFLAASGDEQTTHTSRKRLCAPLTLQSSRAALSIHLRLKQLRRQVEKVVKKRQQQALGKSCFFFFTPKPAGNWSETHMLPETSTTLHSKSKQQISVALLEDDDWQ